MTGCNGNKWFQSPSTMVKVTMFKKRFRRQILSGILCALATTGALANEIKTVDVYRATAEQHRQTLTLTGTVEAKQNAALAPLQSGVIAALFVEVGDKVVKGQKLLSLDAKLAQLSLAQIKASKTAAQAQKDEAQRLYEEVVKLSKKQLVAETLLAERLSALQIAQAGLGRANAQLKQQQEVLSRHTLYAPFSGVIANRQVDLGEWVTQQTPVYTLVEQNQLRLRVAIPQEYFSQLRGTEISEQKVQVTVTPDFTEGLSFGATLDRLVSVANNTSRTLTGLVYLPDNPNLVAGISAKAVIQLPSDEQTLVWLPKSAIKQHPDGGSSVFTVDGNQAKRLLVKITKQQGQKVAVTGLDVDKPFVVSGVELLKDGDKVKVNRTTGSAL